MDDDAQSRSRDEVSPPPPNPPQAESRARVIKWAVVLFVGLAIAWSPVPAGISVQSWRLLAIFAATIVGCILRPIAGGAMVLLGISALAISGALPIREAL